MLESLKIDLSPGLEARSRWKNLRIVLAFWIQKAQNSGSIGCPPELQAAGAGLAR
jgi:hypothetical protein